MLHKLSMQVLISKPINESIEFPRVNLSVGKLETATIVETMNNLEYEHGIVLRSILSSNGIYRLAVSIIFAH